MNESDVKAFWQAHPCGEMKVGGLDCFTDDLESFFREYDGFRYQDSPHILGCLDRIDFQGMKTLEIGLGQGADSEQIVRRGAIWSGLDLTEESVRRVRFRFELKHLPYRSLERGSVLDLHFATDSFDLVFSHGVLHHVPNIGRAQQEIWRVLKPNGRLIIMVYAKFSLNYMLSISLLRRLGLAILYAAGSNPKGIVGQHLRNARKVGLWNYLKNEGFIHKNTDEPSNPYSKVYNLNSVREDFSMFSIVECTKHYMHAPPLPVKWLPLARLLGWHLWVVLKPENKE